MNVAITGATGYIGAALLRSLAAAGKRVTALARRPPTAGEGVTWVRGDVRDPEALARLVLDADAVAHLAAYVHRSAAQPADARECFSVNAGGTRALLEAIERTGRRPRFVLVSTVSVYGGAFEHARETDAEAPDSPYGISKLEAEEAVRRARDWGLVDAVVLRPAVVFGEGAPGNLDRLLRLLSRGVSPLIDGGWNRKSLIHVDDLVRVIAAMLEGPTPHDLYNVAAEPALPLRAIAASLARGLHRPVREVRVPRALADVTGACLRLGAPLRLAAAADLTRTLATFRSNATVDASRLADDLGMAFRPSETSLEAMARALERGRAPRRLTFPDHGAPHHGAPEVAGKHWLPGKDSNLD